MSIAHLFPGQGSQHTGMGEDLLEAFPEVRPLFDRADELLDEPITPIMFGEGLPEEEGEARLRQTQFTQPALFVHSLAAEHILREAGDEPDMTAGHSLGEYSALVAAGAMSFEDGLRAVAERGAAMAEAGSDRPGTMAALLGLDDEGVEAICTEVSGEGDGIVQPANYNAPGQVVISGDRSAVEKAVSEAKERGVKRAIPLSVSGAFHTPLMADARNRLARTLAELDISAPDCPVYLNVTARPTTDPGEIRDRLLEQLTSPVRWAQTLEAMDEEGAVCFLEVGPGRVLSGLVRRTIGREAEWHTVGTAEDLRAYLTA